MGNALGWAITITLWVWAAAEITLQTRQFMRRGVTERSERRTLLVMAVLIVAGMELATPVAHATPSLSYSGDSAALRAVVLVVGLAGIALRLWAIVSLGRFFRGTVHIQRDHQVVRSGPYRWVRHPAYSGALLAALAFEAPLGNPLSWLLCAGCFLAACGYRIRVEERMLSESLGEAYTAYAAETRRLIPGVW
jgi:protein-S-isoprenylcysteine O-methyltransferase Ste14